MVVTSFQSSRLWILLANESIKFAKWNISFTYILDGHHSFYCCDCGNFGSGSTLFVQSWNQNWCAWVLTYWSDIFARYIALESWKTWKCFLGSRMSEVHFYRIQGSLVVGVSFWVNQTLFTSSHLYIKIGRYIYIVDIILWKCYVIMAPVSSITWEMSSFTKLWSEILFLRCGFKHSP